MPVAPPLRWGVVGSGAFATFAGTALLASPSSTIVAVAGRSAVPASRLGHDLGVTACTIEELIADRRVEAVYIATPPSSHGALALRAICAGKHVLLEKPVATGLTEADCLIEAAARHGVTAAVMHLLPFAPLHVMAAQIIASGALGRLLQARVQIDGGRDGLDPSHWIWDERRSGGLLVEHGANFFHLLEGWFGHLGDLEVDWSWQRHGVHGEIERVGASLSCGPDLVIPIAVGFTQATPLNTTTIEIVGDRGRISIDGWIPHRMSVRTLIAAGDGPPVLREAEYADVLAPEDRYSALVTDMFERFAHSVRLGERPPVTLETARQALAVAVRATRAGGPR